MDFVRDKAAEAEKERLLREARAEMSQLAQSATGKRLLELLEVMKNNEAPEVPEARSNLETMMNEIRERHTPAECAYAKNFILRVFSACIETNSADGSPHLYFARIKVNQKTRRKGMTNPSVPNGFIEHRGIDPEVLSLYYIDQILGGRQMEKTDEEIVWDMIEYSESNPFSTKVGVLHPEFNFLVKKKGDEQTLELWTHYEGFKPGEVS
jgi:hypothetical protein